MHAMRRARHISLYDSGDETLFSLCPHDRGKISGIAGSSRHRWLNIFKPLYLVHILCCNRCLIHIHASIVAATTHGLVLMSFLIGFPQKLLSFVAWTSKEKSAVHHAQPLCAVDIVEARVLSHTQFSSTATSFPFLD
jgi:hypothetical protein